MSEATQCTAEAGKQIYSLLPKVMADIGAIGKGKTNTQQNYKFRGIDDALDAINPALVKNSVTLAVSVLEHRLEDTPTGEQDRNGKVNPKQRMVRCVLRLQLRFMAPDGSFVDNTTVGEALDYNGDKATNKAMSVAAKYAFFLGLCIPVAEKVLDDSDHDPKAPPETPSGRQQQNGSQRRNQSSQSKKPANGSHQNGSDKPAANGDQQSAPKDRKAFWQGRIVTCVDVNQLRQGIPAGINKDKELTDEHRAFLIDIAERQAQSREDALAKAGAPGG